MFLECAKDDEDLFDLEGFDQIREDFKTAVEEKVTANLNSNRNFVAAQMAKGVGDGIDDGRSATPGADGAAPSDADADEAASRL